MTPTAAGKKIHRIDIEELVDGVADGEGNVYKSWEVLFRNVHAYVRPRGERERFATERPTGIGTHEITLGALAGIDNTMRVRFKGRTFLISGVVNVDEAGREIMFECSEGE